MHIQREAVAFLRHMNCETGLINSQLTKVKYHSAPSETNQSQS